MGPLPSPGCPWLLTLGIIGAVHTTLSADTGEGKKGLTLGTLGPVLVAEAVTTVAAEPLLHNHKPQ